MKQSIGEENNNTSDNDLISKDQAQKVTFDESIKKDIGKYETFQYRVNELYEKFRDDVNKDRTSLLTTLSIFTFIVTYISVEIQILRYVCDFWRLVGLSLFVLGSFLSFILILQYISKSWIEKDETIPLIQLTTTNWKNIKINCSVAFAVITILILFSFGFIAMRSAQDEYTCKKKNLEEEFEFLTNQIQNEKQINEKELNQLKDRLNSLEEKLNLLEEPQGQ